MEVHPPEHPIHTVREFLIHMFAIILGLLIAIGLEQTVEAIHHRHQRHRLEEDFRNEAARNARILQKHLDVNIPELVQFHAELNAVRAAVPHGGFVDLQLPPEQPGDKGLMYAPERNVWPVASFTGAVALLPEAEAQAYAYLDFQAGEDARDVERIRDVSAQLARFSLATGHDVRPGVHLHLTLAQRDDLLTVLAAQTQQLYQLLRRDNLYMLTCELIAQGVTSIDELEKPHFMVTRQYAP